MQIGISKQRLFLVHTTGNTKAVNPIIANVLNMLLPTTLPIAIALLPSMEEITLTISSGALVPKATIVSPISNLGTLKFKAVLDAPSTRTSAPFTNITNPNISSIIFIIINFHLYLILP